MKQTKQALLDWGQAHYWPALAISKTERVAHGELHWRRKVKSGITRRLMWSRVERWEELAQEQSA